ncbi:Iron-sulfur cluster-binding protein [Olavius sp. associated proteobacterium Delta 1]|nr:Iron-sulfur cluster-binding protein [Olavius sp. associated proteobacterium Delta 1]
MNTPKMYRIRQRFDDTKVEDIGQAVGAELRKLSLTSIKPEQRVAITGGSRGIANIADILKAVVEHIKSFDAQPFIFPAMGSHGGATAEGQVAVLEQLGITESYLNAPILSSMEVTEIARTEDDVPVFVDQNALAADHIVAVNRVKSHTKFKAPIESGLMKMMAIGMGKLKGAEFYHKAAIQYTFPRIITDAARLVIRRTPVLCALAIVENAYGKTALISAMRPETIENKEKELLLLSKKLMAKLPFNDIDLLIVDEMGKDISGVGIDPNVTGRNRDLLGVFDHPVQVKRLFVRDLTAKSKGNAIGIGLSDITTQRLVDKIDYAATYKNCITAISLEKAAVPMHFDTDRKAIEVGLGSMGLTSPEKSKIVRINNTNRLEMVEVSEAYGNELQERSDLEIIGQPQPMIFDEKDNLFPCS